MKFVGVTIHLKATEMLFHVWLFSRVSNDIFVNFVFLLIIVNIIIMATLGRQSSDPISYVQQKICCQICVQTRYLYLSGNYARTIKYHKGIKTNTSIKRGNEKHCV